jgi:hypothetical protein
MNCKNCGCGLPTKRIELGFKQCVDCSTVETYGTVDIVYHKTGNTVQHVDKETANQINKLSRRTGFGSNLGRIGKGGVKEFSRKIEIGCNNNTIGSDGLFQKVHDKVELLYDTFGYTKAANYIAQSLQDYRINTQQAYKLKRMLDLLQTL